MTRYGFAIKALPKSGGKRFGGEDEEQDEETVPAESADTGAPPAAAGPGTDLATDPAGDTQESETVDEAAAPSEDGTETSEDSSADAPASAPEDDSRPWSGDMYDEGDETDPAAAFAAYRGANGEDAWLDQAPDGTLTGWVRDATGQVWRYTDPDVWAIDVDDAQMTRTHSQASGGDETVPAEHGGQDSLFPPKQS